MAILSAKSKRTCIYVHAPARELLASTREGSGLSDQGQRFRPILARKENFRLLVLEGDAVEEFLQRKVAPRLAAAVAVEADMTARRRNDRQQPWIVRPVEGAIVLDRNPRVVARRQHHRWHANLGHELGGRAELIVVFGAVEAV